MKLDMQKDAMHQWNLWKQPEDCCFTSGQFCHFAKKHVFWCFYLKLKPSLCYLYLII